MENRARDYNVTGSCFIMYDDPANRLFFLYLPSIFVEKERNKIKICLCQSEGRPRVLLAPAPFLPTFSRRLIIFLETAVSVTQSKWM
jgi:hypothetical protein